jgi:hypothetical protein
MHFLLQSWPIFFCISAKFLSGLCLDQLWDCKYFNCFESCTWLLHMKGSKATPPNICTSTNNLASRYYTLLMVRMNMIFFAWWSIATRNLAGVSCASLYHCPYTCYTTSNLTTYRFSCTSELLAKEIVLVLQKVSHFTSCVLWSSNHILAVNWARRCLVIVSFKKKGLLERFLVGSTGLTCIGWEEELFSFVIIHVYLVRSLL